MRRLFSTNHHRDWWKHRKIDWKVSYLDTFAHPHRLYLCEQLKMIKFSSVFEVGCGPGANIVPLGLAFPDIALGGSDINPEAIELARKAFPPHFVFEVASGDDLTMSDGSTDVGLTDMMLIYVGPLKIRRYLEELVRISRRYVVLVEFYHPSRWRRFVMTLQGRYTHNYPKLLARLGCSDIQVRKMPAHLWPDARDNDYRYIITART